MAIYPLTKCLVTGSILKPDNTPIYPATVTFTLSRRDRDGLATLLPVSVVTATDPDGNIAVELWPNSEGYAGTSYCVTIAQGSVRFATFSAVVPDTPTANLAEISELVPPPSIDDARAAVILAQAAAAEARESADEAAESAEATAADRVATGQDRVQTGLDAEATAADRVATGQDRVQTGLDAEATAADRVATAGDVLSTAANVVVATDAKNESVAAALNSASSANNAAATKALMDTALTNVTNYNNTLAQLTGGAKLVVSAADVVAAFVYDTSLDSDRGAWRLRCKHTSWFNEALNTATRGARRDFPKKALIVARAASVTIYDMDNKDCPMWMVFNAGVNNSVTLAAGAAITSLVMLNGKLMVGAAGGAAGFLSEIDFISDQSFARLQTTTRFYFRPGLVNRNVAVALQEAGMLAALVSREINAVTATVLPGTPPDRNRAGLPAPTVAVATAGGVSVIHWDGRVANGSLTEAYTTIRFDQTGLIAGRAGTAPQGRRFSYTAIGATGFLGDVIINTGSTPVSFGASVSSQAGSDRASWLATPVGLNGIGWASVTGQSLQAFLTSTYLTGWMPGAIKLALAESTADVTSLVASGVVDDFSTYANVAALLAAGWVESEAGVAGLSGGALTCTMISATNAYVTKSFPTVIGRTYAYSCNLGGPASARFRLGTLAGNGNYINSTTFGSQKGKFVATTTSAWVSLFVATAAETVTLDDLSVTLVALDRSAAGNNPVVVGTVTRQAVATGAELAGYGGFSASNRLEVPGIALGAGDWCFTTWAWFSDVSGSPDQRCLFSQGGTNRWVIEKNSATATLSMGQTGRGNYGPASGLIAQKWQMLLFVRRGTNLEIWIEGLLAGTFAMTSWDASLASGNIFIGARNDGTQSMVNNYMALPRFSATAPTPAQIRAMYADEAPLFQPGAKCLLTGSDNVQGIDFDAATGLLYAAKAAGGTDVFKGLVRVGTINIASEGAAMTSNNHKAVSAVNDNITIVTAAEVYAKLPTVGLRELLSPNNIIPLYDRTTVKTAQAVTTNATPTVIARFPMDKGENGGWIIDSVAMEYGDPTASEIGFFRDLVSTYRPGEGNVSLSGPSVQTIVRRVTATLAIAITANTTTQTIDVTATGIAAKNLNWKVTGVFRLNNEATS